MKDDPNKDRSTNAGPVSPAGEDAALLSRISSLPRAISPSNDPWPSIEQRIRPSSTGSMQAVRPQRQVWLAVAASFMLVTVSVVFVAQNSGSTTTDPAPLPESLPAGGPVPGLTHELNILNERGIRIPALSLEREYQAAFREFRNMEAVADIQPVEMDEGLLLSWEEMQKVEKALLLALEQDPENSMLIHTLTKLRARQLQFLHLIADSGLAPGRNLI